MAFLDSDDTWLPLKLEKQLYELRNDAHDTLAVCCCNFKIIDRLKNKQSVTEYSSADLERRLVTGKRRSRYGHDYAYATL